MEKNYIINLFKCIAIVLVVGAHTGWISNLTIGVFQTKYIFYTLATFSRVTIPFFLVITGYLLEKKLNTSRHPNKFFKRYVIQMLKMYIIWAVFYQVYDITVFTIALFLQGADVKEGLLTFIGSRFTWSRLYYGPNTGTTYHLWYLSSLIWSLAVLLLFIKMKKVYVLLAVSFVFNLIGAFGTSYFFIWDLTVETRDALFLGLFYLSLGYVLGMNRDRAILQMKPNLALTLFVLFGFMQVVEAAIAVIVFNGYLAQYYFSTAPAIVFLVLYIMNYKGVKKRPFVTKIVNRMELIYVVHPLIISISMLIISGIGVDRGEFERSIFRNIFSAPLVFLISYHMYHPLRLLRSWRKRLFSKIVIKRRIEHAVKQ